MERTGPPDVATDVSAAHPRLAGHREALPAADPPTEANVGPGRSFRADGDCPRNDTASDAFASRKTLRSGRRAWWSWRATEGYDREAMDVGGGGESGDALGREALGYADTLYNLARYLTGNQPDAEYLVQETYARALGAAGQFTRGSNLKAWLFRILRNTFISMYRRQRNNPTVGGLDTVDPTAQGPSQEHFLLDDMELDRLRKMVGEEIERALMSLTEEARTVILLDLEGLTEVEMAQVLDCAVGTVKSRLSRARAALRLKLKDYGR